MNNRILNKGRVKCVGSYESLSFFWNYNQMALSIPVLDVLQIVNDLLRGSLLDLFSSSLP